MIEFISGRSPRLDACKMPNLNRNAHMQIPISAKEDHDGSWSTRVHKAASIFDHSATAFAAAGYCYCCYWLVATASATGCYWQMLLLLAVKLDKR